MCFVRITSYFSYHALWQGSLHYPALKLKNLTIPSSHDYYLNKYKGLRHTSSRQSAHHSLLNFARISSATFFAGTLAIKLQWSHTKYIRSYQTLWEESSKLIKNSSRNLERSNWWILQPWMFSTVHMLSTWLALGDNLLRL